MEAESSTVPETDPGPHGRHRRASTVPTTTRPLPLDDSDEEDAAPAPAAKKPRPAKATTSINGLNGEQQHAAMTMFTDEITAFSPARPS